MRPIYSTGYGNFRIVYVIATITMAGLWADQGFKHWLIFLAVGLALWLQQYLPGPEESFRIHAPSTKGLSKEKRIEAFVVSCIILMPYFLMLVWSWNQEYAFLTDHTHHALAALHARRFWAENLPAFLILFPGIYIAHKTKKIKQWAILAGAILLISGFKTGLPIFFARYPALGYFFALPENLIAYLFNWDSTLNIGRLSHVISIAAWLFILRPKIIGKWPDKSILPFAIFFFFQKDIAYYFSSVFLEPWAIVLVITAIEYAIRNPEYPDLSFYLIGLAAMVKEQVIFTLPFFFLLKRPWRLDLQRLLQLTLTGIIVILPFIVYYHKRQTLQPWRSAGIADLSEVFTETRIVTFADRLFNQFGSTGLILVGFTLVCAIFSALFSRSYRLISIVFFSAGVFQVLFFFADKISQSFTGYSRFHMLPLALFGAPLILIGRKLMRSGSTIGLAAISVIIFTAHLPVLAPFFFSHKGPVISRNYFEHYDGPVHFPIQSLIRDAEQNKEFRKIGTIHVFFPMEKEVIDPALTIGYPTLSVRYHMAALTYDDSSDCYCRRNTEAKMLAFIHHANLGKELSDTRYLMKNQQRCIRQIHSSCQYLQPSYFQGNLTGLIGFGIKSFPEIKEH